MSSILSMQYVSTLLGREAVIEFPDSRAEVRSTVKGDMQWRVKDSQGRISEGCEHLSYLQVSDTLHFLNWTERNGFTVSQVINTTEGTVQAFWTLADARYERGQRSSMFVEGRFRFRGQ